MASGTAESGIAAAVFKLWKTLNRTVSNTRSAIYRLPRGDRLTRASEACKCGRKLCDRRIDLERIIRQPQPLSVWEPRQGDGYPQVRRR